MTNRTQVQLNLSGLIVGLAIMAAGVLFTLDNLGFIEAGRLVDYWPVILVAVGIARLVQTSTWSGYAWNLVLILAGLWLTGENVGLVRLSIWKLWPVALVALGLSIVRRVFGDAAPARQPAREPFDSDSAPGASDVVLDGPAAAADAGAAGSAAGSRRPSRTTSHDSHVTMVAVMGGYDRACDSRRFRGATLTAFMGGCDLDLTRASMDGDEAVIDVMALMGGVDIHVPDNWTVSSKVLPVMGGYSDETRPVRTGTTQRLIVRGIACMGGIDINNRPATS